MKTKRLVSLLLALCMALSFLHVGVLANEPTTVTTWAELESALEAGGSVKLGGNVAATAGDSYLIVLENGEAALDLNGYTVDGSALPKATTPLMVWGTLTLTDGIGGGAIVGSRDGTLFVGGSGECTMSGGALSAPDAAKTVDVDSGSFIMDGGSITLANADYDDSCAVSVRKGSFTLNSGTISAEDMLNGCAVSVYCGEDKECGFTMNGGTISFTGVPGEDGESAVKVSGRSSFTVTGGTITAENAEYGAVYVKEYGSFTLTGGTVSAADSGYGGVYVEDDAKFTVSGAPVIGGVFLESDAVITVGGKLSWTAPVPVETKSKPTAGTPVTVTSGLSGNGAASLFTSANKAFSIAGNSENGEAELRSALTLLKNGDALSVGWNEVTIGGDYTFTAPEEFGGYIFTFVSGCCLEAGLFLGEESLDRKIGYEFSLSDGLSKRQTCTLKTAAEDSGDDGKSCLVLVEYQEPVTYVDEYGTEQLCANYRVIAPDDYSSPYLRLSEPGWYVVTGQISAISINLANGFRKALLSNAATPAYALPADEDEPDEPEDPEAYCLILSDGASLTLSDGFNCGSTSLAVYGQSAGTGTLAVGSPDSPGDDEDGAFYVQYGLTVYGGNISVWAEEDAIRVRKGGCRILGGSVTAMGGAGYNGLYAENGDTVLSGGSVTLSSVYEGVTLTRSFTDGTSLYPAGDWTADAFNAAGTGPAGKTLRTVGVTGVWGGDGKLTAKFAAPVNSLLIASVYDKNGRQVNVRCHGITAPDIASITTGLAAKDGVSFKIMLVDQNYAPLCPAWQYGLGVK